MLNPHHILTFSTGIKKLTQTICIFVILSINSRFSTFVTTTSEFPAKNMKMPDFYSPSAMPESPHYRNPTQYVAEKYFSFLPVLPSKTDIRNPLSLLAHERSLCDLRSNFTFFTESLIVKIRSNFPDSAAFCNGSRSAKDIRTSISG